VRAPEFEPSLELIIVCVGRLVRPSRFEPSFLD
jgi:hypothetical protein